MSLSRSRELLIFTGETNPAEVVENIIRSQNRENQLSHAIRDWKETVKVVEKFI